jgi:2-succinyl-6-hydroxy-2,4-cyclohexadiene-1-carboxylate synthase
MIDADPASGLPTLDVHVDVGDGLRLHVQVSGDGTPLVLLHGFTGSAESWSALRPRLAAGHRVLAVDLPGHGRSDAPEDAQRYALHRLADDLATVLDAFGETRVAVLGYSLGARAALAFAARHPARIGALVLVSASPGIADQAARAIRAAADAELAGWIEHHGLAAFVDRWEALPLWESQRALPAAVRQVLRAQRLAGNPRGLANSLRGAGQGAAPPLGSALEAVVAPALLVAGALDTRYVALGESLARELPNARLVVVPGAGHAVALERPDDLLHHVLEFLDAR